MSRPKWLIPLMLAFFASACAVQVSDPDGQSDVGEGAQSLGNDAPPPPAQPGADGVSVVDPTKPTPDPWGGGMIDPGKPTPDPWRPAPGASGSNDDGNGTSSSGDTTAQSSGTTQAGH